MRRDPLALVLAACLATVALATTPLRTHACSCAALTPEQALEHADAAFVGTVLGSTNPMPGFGGNPPREAFYTFAVEAVARGDLAPQVQLAAGTDGASCGTTFGASERWLVFAMGDGGRLSTGLCSGNILLASGEVPPIPVRPLSIAPSASGRFGVPVPVLLAMGALVVLASVSVWAFRRGKDTA